jgi:hypothetical protein
MWPSRFRGYQTALLGLCVVLLGLWVGQAGLRWRSSDVTTVLLMLLFVGLSLRYTRCMADAAMFLFPLATATLSARLGRRAPGAPRRERRLVALGLLLLGALTVETTVRTMPQPVPHRYRRVWGWGLDAQAQPLCATDFLQRYHVMGRGFVDIRSASLVLWRLWPQVRVGIDARDFAAGEQAHRDYFLAQHVPAALQVYLERHQINFLLLRPRNLTLEHYKRLRDLLGWVFVHLDDRFFVMVPPRPANAALLAEQGYRHILPWLNMPVTPMNAPAVLREADRALAACPEGATFAWAYRAQALRWLGRGEESRAAQRKVPAQLWIE